MVKRDGHIDLVFRDGLKNLEVLPPADIWEGIAPHMVRPKSRAFAFRVAAGIAAIVSLGFISFFIGTRSTDNLIQPLLAESQIEEAGNDILVAEASGNIILPETTSESEIMGTPRASFISGETVSETIVTDSKPVNNISSGNIQATNGNIANLFKTDQLKSKSGFRSLPARSGSVLFVPIENLAEEKEANRWMLGAKMSPTYLSSNLKAANSSFGELANDESAVISYTGGITISYSMGGRLSLQTGILYSSLGRQISGINSYSGFAGLYEAKGGKLFGVETSSGEIASTNNDIFLSDGSADRISSIYSIDNFDPLKSDLEPYGTSLRQNFEYLEVPLILSYKFIDRKVDFNIMGGLSYNFLLDNSTYAVADGSKIEIGSTQDVTHLLLSSALGMSMEYSLNEKFSLNLEPSFRYYLNYDGRLTSHNPFTFGLFSGLYYKF